MAPAMRSRLLLVLLLVGLRPLPALAGEGRGVTLEVDTGVAAVLVPSSDNGPIVAVVPLSVAVAGFLRKYPRIGARLGLAWFRNRSRGDQLWSIHALVEKTWRRGRARLGVGGGLHLIIPPPMSDVALEPDRGLATAMRLGWVLDRSADQSVSIVASLMPSFFGGMEPVYEAGIALSWEAP